MSLGIDGVAVLADLHWLLKESEMRCLVDAEQWASEMLFYVSEDWHSSYVKHKSAQPETAQMDYSTTEPHLVKVAAFGRALIKKKEFYRAAYFLKQVKVSSYDRFMYYWARYLAYEYNRLETEADSIGRMEYDDSELKELHNELCLLGSDHPEYFDTFLLYILAKVRCSLKLKDKAKEAFLESVALNRAMWPSWEELIMLVDSVDEAETEAYSADGHWMYQFFRAAVLSRFQLHKNALEQYEKLSECGFLNMPYIMNQVAASLNNMQEHDMALEFFKKVRKIDPYRVEQMHLFSDSLYVRGFRSDLADLAHTFFKTHKFCWETCCIIANYYSLRGEHEKAVVFLQRSLKLNPNNAAAWTLIGHEFMEQKNNPAACLAYRKAIEADSHDYRGWYGLGQLYDILKMPSYSLYYYQQAHKCKPDDSRMLVALGEVYVRLSQIPDAQKCFLKAYKVGDVEGTALMLLGKLYAKCYDNDQAALIYEKYLNVYGEEFMDDLNNVATCCSFLAKYYLKKGDLDTATPFAQRCLEYDTTKEEGRNTLRQISQLHHRYSVLPETLVAASNATPMVAMHPGNVQCQGIHVLPSESSTPLHGFRTPTIEEGEAEMAISSDASDVSDESSLNASY
ncbi:anaphase promoting complex subunit 8/cdc23 family protein, variant [Loa loa]|uniref:Anaphase promoting complex subunit 8/cdc23 family protein n=1 Tax=Loa loa TaxID=7209 RepID=A0A1S0U848_LOALO|nr:anaphase promoting complex subunit 8/cdc23 family protein [Loa loa]XP_020306122.1 anaphase promoting complex subunit 8/cdc23 family protein, variant [Loa loa]EFO26723.1 anaphase promoting complex subunit 8/cdc23 family protein [Loa loa]EJD75246.1 anaphase promoting complex subunit 8/cdc23 family protein, variant [Loa loa]